MQDITSELASAFNIPTGQGAVVTRVQEGSAPNEAGLQIGNVILNIDGEKLSNADSLRNTVGLLMVGQTIKMNILRNNTNQTIKATVKEIQKQIESAHVHPKLSGASFGDIKTGSSFYGRIKGVMVYDVKALPRVLA
jgi:C-terminal processing protease CtpA/Prc